MKPPETGDPAEIFADSLRAGAPSTSSLMGHKVPTFFQVTARPWYTVVPCASGRDRGPRGLQHQMTENARRKGNERVSPDHPPCGHGRIFLPQSRYRRNPSLRGKPVIVGADPRGGMGRGCGQHGIVRGTHLRGCTPRCQSRGHLNGALTGFTSVLILTGISQCLRS